MVKKKKSKESRIIVNHKSLKEIKENKLINDKKNKKNSSKITNDKKFDNAKLQDKTFIRDKKQIKKHKEGVKNQRSNKKQDKQTKHKKRRLFNHRLNKIQIKKFSEKVKKIRHEVSKVVIGQERVVDGLVRAMICNGHIILEGVPGIAKTLLIKALGRVSGCEVKRIQFTVDLLPTDIIGLTIYREKLGFEIVKGPVFANFVIADEINRAPPKTQSALLEAMQEKQVTIGRKTFFLPKPFFVMATKNPIESAGVYSMPEAQVDRFLFKLLMGYPEIEEEKLVMKRNIESDSFEDFKLRQIISPEEIIKMQNLVKEIYLSPGLEDYIVNIVDYTRNKKTKYSQYIEWGASPRASIAFFMASKAEALMGGRNFVVPEDIKGVALDILRHRLILSYEAEANSITPDYLIKKILGEVEINPLGS